LLHLDGTSVCEHAKMLRHMYIACVVLDGLYWGMGQFHWPWYG